MGVLVYMFSGLVGGMYWATRGAPRLAIVGRGAQVADGAQFQVAAQRERKKALGRPDDKFPLTLAGVAVPFEDEAKHFKLMGTTGVGKSSAMRELLHAALYRGDRAIIADPDGGYLSRFYDPKRGDVILNPFDARSAKWDLYGELRNAYDIDQLARALIPDRSGADTTWTGYGRTFFSAVVRQTRLAGLTDLGELYRLLTTASREELRLVVAGTPAAPFLEEGSDRLFSGARSTTTGAVQSLDYIQAQTGAGLSVREWVKSGRGVLFLPYQADQIAALKSIISTWMRLAISQTLSLREGDNRMWFAVDALDALGAIDGLSDALPRLRKFGGRCVLGFQSISPIGPGSVPTLAVPLAFQIQQMQNSLCTSGNLFAQQADVLGGASAKIEGGALLVGLAGAVTAQPEVTVPAMTLAAAGGVGSLAAGALQFAAGLLQGLGGAGFDNAYNAAATLGSGKALSLLFGGPAVSGYRTVSQRATDSFLNNSAVTTGGFFDTLTGLVQQLAPRQVVCP